MAALLEHIAKMKQEGAQNFALFRYPDAQDVHLVQQLQGEAAVITDLCPLRQLTGFLIAPFEASGAHPVVLISPDVHLVGGYADMPEANMQICQVNAAEAQQRYEQGFALCKAALDAGVVTKTVLARTCDYEVQTGSADYFHLFFEACRAYPHLYIALWQTPATGLWLVATPELLLSVSGTSGQTMALAGTMKLRTEEQPTAVQDWSDKNIEEQQLVARYIADRISPYTTQQVGSTTYPHMAADLVHLRTDIRFELCDEASCGALLRALHPTPAVCGLPVEPSKALIRQTEVSRAYYAGFSGYVEEQAKRADLFVSLRCLHATETHLRLFAGGGLLPSSTLASEWQETERKLNTMQRLLRPYIMSHH